jgi:hypothetical protein
MPSCGDLMIFELHSDGLLTKAFVQISRRDPRQTFSRLFLPFICSARNKKACQVIFSEEHPKFSSILTQTFRQGCRLPVDGELSGNLIN